MSKHQHHLENVFKHKWLDLTLLLLSQWFWSGAWEFAYLSSQLTRLGGSEGYTLETSVLKQPTSDVGKDLPQATPGLPPISARPIDVHRLMPERIEDLAGYQRPAKSNNIVTGNKTHLASHWNITTHYQGRGWAVGVFLWTTVELLGPIIGRTN